jgi:hypothetical protein
LGVVEWLLIRKERGGGGGGGGGGWGWWWWCSMIRDTNCVYVFGLLPVCAEFSSLLPADAVSGAAVFAKMAS